MIRFIALTLLVTVTCCQGSVIQTEKADPIQENEVPHNSSYQAVQQPGEVTLQSESENLFAANTRLQLLKELATHKDLFGKLKSVTPKILKQFVRVIGKVGIVAVVALSVVFLGIGFTAAICNYTNVCSSKLASLELDKLDSEHVEEVMRAYMSQDKLSTLTNFVLKSIHEFSTKNEKDQ